MLVRAAADNEPSSSTDACSSPITKPSDTRIMVFGASIVLSAVRIDRSALIVSRPSTVLCSAFS